MFLAAAAFPVWTHAADVTSTWIGAAFTTESWSVAANWSNTPAVSQYPNNGNGGFTYDAIVDNNGIAMLSEAITLNRLTHTSGTIDGDHNMLVNEHMLWNGGSLRGNGTITIPVGATLQISGPTRRTLTRTFDNFGVATWTGGGVTGDAFAALGVFNNKPGATFYANCSFGPTTAFGNGSFNNEGLHVDRRCHDIGLDDAVHAGRPSADRHRFRRARRAARRRLGLRQHRHPRRQSGAFSHHRGTELHQHRQLLQFRNDGRRQQFSAESQRRSHQHRHDRYQRRNDRRLRDDKPACDH
jgi:hypothetical protein